jgi:hypothetical protein
MISILEFLRTGYFGPVTVGIPRIEVLQKLGEPDWFQDYSTRVETWQQKVEVCTDSDFWQYSGVQFFFDHVNDILSGITFRPRYFHNQHLDKTQVDSWIFKNGYQPTKQEFILALEKESIEVKDTGVLLLVQSGKTGRLKHIRSEKDLQPNEKLDEEDSGFLVLKSGVEVLYAGNNILPDVADQDGTNKVSYIGIAVGGMFTFENEPLEQLRSFW